MKMTVRGWNRNMGEKTIANFWLTKCKTTNSITFYERGIPDDNPVKIIWGEQLDLNGRYFCELRFGEIDISRMVSVHLKGKNSQQVLKFLKRSGIDFDDETILKFFLERFGDSGLRDVLRVMRAQVVADEGAGAAAEEAA